MDEDIVFKLEVQRVLTLQKDIVPFTFSSEIFRVITEKLKIKREYTWELET